MLFTWIDYQPSDYNGYKFPVWADVLGWMMTMSSVVAIPVVMVYKICTAPKKDSLFEVRVLLIDPSFLCLVIFTDGLGDVVAVLHFMHTLFYDVRTLSRVPMLSLTVYDVTLACRRSRSCASRCPTGDRPLITYRRTT